MTQQELAGKVGCSVSLIFKIEADERRPSRQVAELLAQHLDVPSDQRPLFLKIARQEKGIQSLDSLPHPSTPPPGPAIEPLTSRLPVPPTPLVGREPEIGMVLRQLQDPSCRLLTFTGPGGVGKTRLALEVAHRARDLFEHGACFVPLVGVTSPDFILPAVAEALGFTFSGSSDPKSQLFSFLKGRRLLLVLDNLEQLTNDVGLLAELLENLPGLTILATSREQLNLRAEWAFAVQGLPLPGHASLDNLEANSALALFLQRARQARLDFTLAAGDLPHAERICHLVEGLPLGIELAATWVRSLSCGEIAREIETNLDFLTTHARDLPARHRSMRAVFDYSWQLLSGQEQRAMMGLSVFRGGFTREAAERVAGAGLSLLAALIDKSLVRHDPAGRFDLHELVRQFARAKLDGSGGLAEACSRHFDFFLAFAEESRTELRGRHQLAWLNRMEDDYDNLRAALEWSLRFEGAEEDASPEREAAIQASFRLAGALYVFWRLRNHWAEGRNWLRRVLSLPAQQTVTQARARALNAAVLLATEQADLHVARQLADENLVLAQALGNPHVLARALHSRGVVLWKQKDFPAAHDSCEQAVALFRRLENRHAVAGSLQILGRIATNQHRLEEAHAYLGECVEIFQDLSNTIEYNASLSDLGLIAYLREDFPTARAHHERSLVLFREARNIAGTEMSLNRLADVARCEGDYAEAERLYTESLSIYNESGDKDEIASLLHNLGHVANRRGDHAKALSLFRQALALQLELDNTAGIAECFAGIAGVWTATGRDQDAGRLFGTAESLREACGAVLWPANRLEYERSLACLRAALDEKTLASAWAEGRGAPVEQAAAAALQA